MEVTINCPYCKEEQRFFIEPEDYDTIHNYRHTCENCNRCFWVEMDCTWDYNEEAIEMDKENEDRFYNAVVFLNNNWFKREEISREIQWNTSYVKYIYTKWNVKIYEDNWTFIETPTFKREFKTEKELIVYMIEELGYNPVYIRLD